MARIRLREQAREMRSRGKSIKQIASVLRVSKSTVSYWCRDIALTKKQMRNLLQNQIDGAAIGRLRAAEIKRAARLEATRVEYARGAAAIGTITKRDLFMLGLALYWGEGYKSGNEECGLTNSNPDIIGAYMRWLKLIYEISPKDLILRVSINETHRNRMREVEKHWSQLTEVPLSQFTKTSLIKMHSKKIYSNADSHFGTLRIKVRKATALRRRILGSIQEIARQVH